MGSTLVIILSVIMLSTVTVALLFRPVVAFAVGVVGAVVFSITIIHVLHFEGGVSLSWLIFMVFGIVLLRVKYGIKLWENSLSDWAMLALALIVLVSLKYTPSPEYGRHKVLLFLGSCVPLYYLGRMCGRNPEIIRMTMHSGAWFSTAIVWLFFLILLSATEYLTAMDRFGGGMAIMYAIWITTCVGFLVYWLYCGNLFQKTAALVAMAVAISVLPFTASRGAVVFLLLGAGLTFMTFRRFFRSMLVLVLILGMLGVAARFLAPAIFYERMKQLSYAESDRKELFEIAVRVFMNYPIKGIGAGGFSQFYTATFRWVPIRRSYPHNLWLEIASEQGLIGLIPLAILTVMGIWHLLRIRRDPDIALSRAVQMVFWISFFQACFTGDLPMDRGFFACLGLLAGYNLWLREQKAFEEMPMGPSEEGVVPSL